MNTMVWRAGPHALECGPRSLVMGVINVTPDSFSDGGRFHDPEVAVERGIRMVEEGADLLDVGGESTRPGAEAVMIDEELRRVIPVIKRLAAEVDAPVSIDTSKHQVAAAALDAGAAIVNDVTAGHDPLMFDVVRASAAGMVLMHMQGEPRTMQRNPRYGDVVRDIHGYLRRRAEAAREAGIARDRLAVDPGLGFGKTYHQDLQLMKEVDQFLDLGYPVLVGPSRKSFIGTALGDLPVHERLEGTAGAVAYMVIRGAHVVRVHDVKEMVRMLKVIDAIRNAG